MPAIVLNEYGTGKTVYFAFAPELSPEAENYDLLSNLIKNSITHVHTPLDTTAFYPGQMVPVLISLRSLGSAFDLRITEIYPADMKLYDPVSGKWTPENPWTQNLLLAPGETKTILFYVLTSEEIGIYSLETEVGYLDNGVYSFYQSVRIDITVE